MKNQTAIEKPEWGGWRFHVEQRTLEIGSKDDHSGLWYYVDLREVGGPLYWIRHVSEKTWATDAIVAGLARALADVDEHKDDLRR